MLRELGIITLLALPSFSIGLNAEVLLSDSAELGICLGLNTWLRHDAEPPPFRSTCLNDGSGKVTVSSYAARSGSFGYVLPVRFGDAKLTEPSRGIHVAKLAARTGRLKSAQRVGSTIRYQAYFYIESGFDDFGKAWHIQMQWKGYRDDRVGEDKYWLGQNPKIAWGFTRPMSNSGTPEPLQIVAVIRDAHPEKCDKFSYHHFSRASLGMTPIEVPTKKWVLVTVEIFFHSTLGYVKIWQGIEGQEHLVVDTGYIDTVSQLVERDIAKPSDSHCDPAKRNLYKRTSPSHFTFGIANYLSTLSFSPKYRTRDEDHILYVDDIHVTLVRESSILSNE